MTSTKFPLTTSYFYKKINAHKWYLNHSKFRIHKMIHCWNMQLHSTDASSSSHLLIHNQTWIITNTKSKLWRNKNLMYLTYILQHFLISFKKAFSKFFFSLHVYSSYSLEMKKIYFKSVAEYLSLHFKQKFHCTETTVFERTVLQQRS